MGLNNPDNQEYLIADHSPLNDIKTTFDHLEKFSFYVINGAEGVVHILKN